MGRPLPPETVRLGIPVEAIWARAAVKMAEQTGKFAEVSVAPDVTLL
jgi:hypothetical protein